ncbi:hypothetical protein SAMN06265222_101440 [Neorhodopirellula lusitana]|uniref:Uncharacterized protein n=1 Tax=Neorhodopirellula lusitana TaxID=445327 RepID=A0ABY1PT93_9BACT|nr:hypothetical protein [Neorhodopirellula lusitana]SMP40415.1 hypothetical protein SAMN06265222_101440 [Neorhodopirellula lusitana]
MPQSVQCPRCQAAVAVGDDVGGSRIGCPSCGQSFIVPGFVSQSESPGDTSAGSPVAAGAGPVASSSDDFMLFDDEVDVVEIVDDVLDDDDLVAAMEVADSNPYENQPPEKKKPVYASEFKVRCPHCGTQTDTTAAKAGKQIKCRDCHSSIRVGQPPRVRPKVEMDMSTAPVFSFSPSVTTQTDRPADPFRKSADEYLAAASKVEDKEPKATFDDVPSIRDWAEAVFGIFLQVGVMAHWLVLSTIASTVAFVAIAIGHPALEMALYPAGAMFAVVVLACGFAIMQSVANEEESVTEWPVGLELSEWLAPTVFCIVAAFLASFPGLAAGGLTMGASLTTVCLTMISLFAIFPFALLSMMDMQSVFVPFSPEVGRSVTRCEEAWGGFYFSSGIIFFFTFLIFAFASGFAGPASAVVSIFVAVAAAFTYFAMLGRLAFAIGRSVNAEPKENNINEVRAAERKQDE